MIKKIEIKNFKSIGDPGVEIELKPITLLFGPNSAGKSTIIHALHYAKEIMRGNFEPSITQTGGSIIDFGNFTKLVHRQEVNRNIKLKFELDFCGNDIPGIDIDDLYLEEDEISEEESDKKEEMWIKNHYSLDRFSSEVELATVYLEIAYDEKKEKARAIKYDISVNSIDFVTIKLEDSNPQNTYPYFSYINIAHPALSDLNSDEPPGSFFESVTKTDLENFSLRIIKADTVIPVKNRVEIDPETFELYDFGIDEPKNLPFFFNNYKYLLRLVCRVIVSISDQLRDELNMFLYVGPLRELPPRNFAPVLPVQKYRWFNGLAAWDNLYLSSELIKETNSWMNKIGITYQLQLLNLIELDDHTIQRMKEVIFKKEEILNQIAEIFDFYSGNLEKSKTDIIKKLFEIISKSNQKFNNIFVKPGYKKLYLTDKDNVKLLPHDLGVGISQVLPIIVAVLHNNPNGSLIAIEQPELHIHPAMQVLLSDLFISQINPLRVFKKYFLIETHSEHLMLRFLRRIEERNTKPNSEYQLNPKDINVYWCESSDNGLKVELLPIDETGEFTRQWPRGFFEERAEELFPNE